MAAPDCDKVLLVQAEFDGELDAADAAMLAVHRAGCPVCQAAAADLARVRAVIGEGLYQPAPDELRRRIVAQITATQPRRTAVAVPSLLERLVGLWREAASFGLGAACAAALAFLVLVPRTPDLIEQLVAGHIRALQPGHLEDVASSDRHTVKPWFDGRIDFAPPVKDLAGVNFPLIGGRLDYLGGRPVAALVYQRDKHLIDLFVWPASSEMLSPDAAQRQGYNLVHWTQDRMNFWAVSDLELGQLQQFEANWRRSP